MAIYSKNNELIVIVGGGITGLTLAERFANEAGKKVLLIEKRDHIGGNCYDFINKNGILVSKYGPHIFHTNEENVWKYVEKFAEWEKYEHRVLSKVGEKLVPVPVNIKTINLLFGVDLKSGEEMKGWLETKRNKTIKVPTNGREVIVEKLGEEIYQMMFKDYTKKQWDMWPEELSPEVLARIPVRYSFDNNYNSDKYQMRPVGGFTKIFEKMISNPRIEVKLNTDFFDIYGDLPKESKIIFTGPIDDYAKHMGEKIPKLPYRSVKFKWKSYQEDYHQPVGVINYPSFDKKELRSTEYKYLTGQKHEWTTISKEYFQWEGEPCYPVINSQNREKYQKIYKLSKKWKNVRFAGRLGKYEYLNMDRAIMDALDLFNKLNNEY